MIAPLLWAAVAGAPAVLAHRAVNTMDAMVGHHDERYERYGWASARLDDVAAWIPSRVTAALVALCSPAERAAIWRAVRHDAPHHPSPNSGVAEAAFAAALDLRLGGANRYGDRTELRAALGGGAPPVAADIARSTRLAARVDVAAALGVAAIAAAGRFSASTPRRATTRSLSPMAADLVYAFRVMRLPLLDAGGSTIGRLDDIVVVPGRGPDDAPKVVGFVASSQRRRIFVNVGRVVIDSRRRPPAVVGHRPQPVRAPSPARSCSARTSSTARSATRRSATSPCARSPGRATTRPTRSPRCA